ncbi:MAG: carboxymuconolactone decarboxylase family protein [Gemmatimonadetes bacterium]|nr:carboxymuconolactone decarboxylase family protein [Gemmatimonadota bacterium]
MTFDKATRALVRLAARIAGGSEVDVRDGLRETAGAGTPEGWVEELILQSYLFCGFPRTLNAAREWRRTAGRNEEEVEAKGRGTAGGTGDEMVPDFLASGEATCALVYGRFYSKLRQNIVALHPELDTWMIVEGYGKVLSRPGLDLGRRELCIVAACVASGQDRQLHSHLHGSRNVGVPDDVIGAALDGLEGTVNPELLERAVGLWGKVKGQV